MKLRTEVTRAAIPQGTLYGTLIPRKSASVMAEKEGDGVFKTKSQIN